MFPLNTVSFLLIALQLLPRAVALEADLQNSNDSLHAPNIGLTNADFINTTIPPADYLKIPDLTFQSDLLINGGYNIAWQARPLWHFSRYLGHDTCYPQSATTLTGDQAQGVELGHWPDTNSGCDSPGEGKWSKAFPTYYSISKCNDSEVRVVYNLFFPKDGWGLGGTGHKYDWERIYLTWKKEGNEWAPTEVAYSYHGSYNKYKWDEVWTTNTDDRNQAPEDGVNMKMPKVFVSWGKHATFREKCGGSHGYCCCALGDILSENLPWAQRSDDYYYVAEEGYLLNAGRETELGKKIAGFAWGGTSYPGVVQDTICEK